MAPNLLFSVVLQNDFDGLKQALSDQANHYLINSYDYHGYYPIHLAAAKDYNLTKLLLDYKAFPDVCIADTNKTPLHIACSSSKDVETVKLLIRHGCNPLDKDINGNNALQHAKNHKNVQVVEFLENYCGYERYFVNKKEFETFMELLRKESKSVFPELLERFEPIQAMERIQIFLTKQSSDKLALDRIFKLLFNLDLLELDDVGELADVSNLTTAFVILVYLKEVYGRLVDNLSKGLVKETMINHGIALTLTVLKAEHKMILDLINSKYANDLQKKCNFDISIRKYIELFVCIETNVLNKTELITQQLINNVFLSTNVNISPPTTLVANKFTLCGESAVSGGYGTFYKCFDGNQFVALKILDKVSDSEEMEKSFTREKSLEILKHPNIISLLHHGTTNHPENPRKTYPFIVTAFANGGSLKQTLNLWKDVIPLNLSIDWMIQIAYGISYLHTVGKIHRDIKPDNVVIVYGDHSSYKSMIESELLHGITPNSKLKIIDFGLTRDDNPGNNTSGRGSPKYIAPEVLIQDSNYFKSADIYSLGITFIDLIVGLFTKEYLKHFLEGEVKKTSEELYTLIKEMIQTEPTSRPTINDVLEYLEDLKRGFPVKLKK